MPFQAESSRIMTRGIRAAAMFAVLLALWMLWRPSSSDTLEAAAPAASSAVDQVPRSDDPQLVGVEPQSREQVGLLPVDAYAARPASGVSISGSVIDPSGEAIPSASVSCSHAGPVSADAAGHFSLEALPPGEHRLWTVAEGFTSIPPPPVRAPDGARVAGVSLVLVPATALAGKLFADDGSRVVAGATVSATVRSMDHFDAALPASGPWSEARLTTSGPDGAFRLAGLPPGQVELTVTHPDFAVFGRLYASGAEDLRIALTRAGAVTGRVVQADGGAVSITRISVLVSSGEAAGPWRLLGEPLEVAPEDAERGLFRVRPRTLNWLMLAVEGPDIQRVTSAAFRLDESFAYGPVVLRANSGPRLRGRVLDELGRGVQAAELVLVEARRPGGFGLAASPVLTSASGAFESAPLVPGEYRVEVRREGYFPTEVEDLLVEGQRGLPPLEIELTRGGALRGRVFARGGGTLPQLHAEVLALGESAASARPQPDPQRVLAPGGTFHFPCLEPGTYRLRLVGGSGDPLHEAELEVVAGQVQRVALDLDAADGVALSGTLTWNGVPVPSVVVSLGRTPETPGWRCTTDRTGRYQFAAVGQGAFVLAARAGRSESFLGHRLVELQRGAPAQHDLNLTTGAITGRLLFEGRAPHAGPRILIEQDFGDLGIHRIARLGVDAEGRFESAVLPAGRLLLSTQFDYKANVRRWPIDVGGAAETALDELVLASTGSVSIHVKRPSSVFLSSDIEIEVRGLGEDVLLRQQLFTPGQRLVVSELPAGPVDVLVHCLADGSLALAQLVVVAGESRTAVLQF